MSAVRWLLIRGGIETAACFAETKRDAEAVLRPEPGAYVTSEASWSVGLPKVVRLALERPALCVRCGVRPITGVYATKRLCPPCGAGDQARYREARSARHGKRGPDRGPRKATAKAADHRARIGLALRHAWEAKRARGA